MFESTDSNISKYIKSLVVALINKIVRYKCTIYMSNLSIKRIIPDFCTSVTKNK